MTTPPPTGTPDVTHAADKLLQAGVGSANVLLIVVLYLVVQLYELAGQVRDLSRADAQREAAIAAHDVRLASQDARLVNLERAARVAP